MNRTVATALLILSLCCSMPSQTKAHHSGMLDALLTILRDRNTNYDDFRIAANKLAYLLAAQAAEKLETISVALETPLSRTTGTLLAHDIVLVPIVRSGLALLPSFMEMFEASKVGFVVLQRDEETALPQLFYAKFPEFTENTRIIILEPMIATGGSVTAALKILNNRGIPNEHIIVVSVVVSTEGLKNVKGDFPGVTLIYAAEDPYLNTKKYIVPGLGDFGDRYFGTV